MEYNEEINETDMNEENQPGTMKQWLQDNLRIIISVLIVVLIAGGIYSYSKRAVAPTAEQQSQQGNVLSEISGSDQNNSNEQSATVQEGNQAGSQAGSQVENKQATQEQKKDTSSIATSQETDKSFVETAVRGDSATKLARRALANYLEKNPDSTLTAEHKIYIEDFLRKNAGPQKGAVRIGTSVEFSKDLVQNAISKSKTLNDKQLKNLHKYAVRVPSLS